MREDAEQMLYLEAAFAISYEMNNNNNKIYFL